MERSQSYKCFITGGNGFIGRKLIEAISQRGHEIRALSRSANKVFPVGVHVVAGDLTSDNCPLGQFLEDCDVVFHCAGELHDVAAMQRLHVGGTERLLRAVEKEAAKRKRVIHWVQLSSVGAYGPPQGPSNADRVVTEDTPMRPIGEYEITKAQSDELVIHGRDSGLISYSIVRPSNVFGANMTNNSLRSLGMMVHKGVFFYVGRPGSVATYVHVDDVVKALLLCGFDDRAKGNIFNLSNDCLLEELVSGIALALGVPRPWLRFPESLVRVVTLIAGKIIRIPLSQQRINALTIRTRYPYLKLEKELGFSPQKSVPETIGEVMLNK